MNRNKFVRKGIDLAAWLRGGLMERVGTYEPNVLDNEVPVFRTPMEELFANHKVYAFGYGSLLYADGWWGRRMKIEPGPEDLQECTINGYQRGPWGLYNHSNFYGVIATKKAKTNGVVVRIHSLADWVELMATEMIAGLYRYANYRAVDVTSVVTDIKLPKGSKVHCVCNRPVNRKLVLDSTPYHRYYNRTWAGVLRERSPGFAVKFLGQGGFKDDEGVWDFMEKLRTKDRKKMLNLGKAKRRSAGVG
jgi:hypothetical protein